jgi:protein-S-isoprenylcysteine O-methyltransferase Ste14
MFTEECYLEKQFGEEFIQWSMKVPAFMPAFKQFEKGDIPFSFKSVLRREYSGAFAITLCFTFVDYMRYYAIILQDNIMQPQWIRLSLFCLAVMAALTIVLRTLKHYTPILNRDVDRD